MPLSVLLKEVRNVMMIKNVACEVYIDVEKVSDTVDT